LLAEIAYQEHLDILARGVEAWNNWRGQNPDNHPDLSGVDPSDADLNHAHLRGANLISAHLMNVNPQSILSGNRQGLPRELLYFRDNQIQFVKERRIN
jgi:uncharacterized protein YjbI with pentapeptide repeats